MAMPINTNLTSMHTQQNLNRASGAMAKSYNRLSSGLRINNASDDPSGLSPLQKVLSKLTTLSRAKAWHLCYPDYQESSMILTG